MTVPEVQQWAREHWLPGEHILIDAPSGEGKSTVAHLVLHTRKYGLALDPKGGDETLAALGWPRLPTWPGAKKLVRMVERNDEEGRPSRWIVGGVANTREEQAQLRLTIARCLDDVYDLGHFTLYNDELQVTCDRRQMNLSGPMARILVAARSKGVSSVNSAQGDSWIIGEAKRQAKYLIVGHTQNQEAQDALAAMIGRRRSQARGLIRGLGASPYAWAIASRSPREPIILFHPPYVAKTTPSRK